MDGTHHLGMLARHLAEWAGGQLNMSTIAIIDHARRESQTGEHIPDLPGAVLPRQVLHRHLRFRPASTRIFCSQSGDIRLSVKRLRQHCGQLLVPVVQARRVATRVVNHLVEHPRSSWSTATVDEAIDKSSLLQDLEMEPGCRQVKPDPPSEAGRIHRSVGSTQDLQQASSRGHREGRVTTFRHHVGHPNSLV
jgi:hypothetical protein